jgi:hypothetical protein
VLQVHYTYDIELKKEGYYLMTRKTDDKVTITLQYQPLNNNFLIKEYFEGKQVNITTPAYQDALEVIAELEEMAKEDQRLKTLGGQR